MKSLKCASGRLSGLSLAKLSSGKMGEPFSQVAGGHKRPAQASMTSCGAEMGDIYSALAAKVIEGWAKRERAPAAFPMTQAKRIAFLAACSEQLSADPR